MPTIIGKAILEDYKVRELFEHIESKLCLSAIMLFDTKLTKIILQPLAPPWLFPVTFWMIAAGRVVGHPGAVSWAPGENPGGEKRSGKSTFSAFFGDLRAGCTIFLISRAVICCFWECETVLRQAGAVAIWAETATQGRALASTADTLATGHHSQG